MPSPSVSCTSGFVPRPDSIEEYLGSDPNNIDTDGDGLNDFYEVFGTYTDPTKADTDDNGASSKPSPSVSATSGSVP